MLRQKLSLINSHFILAQRQSTLIQSQIRKISAEVVSKSKVNAFNSGLHMQPHFQKVAKGGEDAASVSENVLAVADGVGGWAESGVDPAIFSKRLCKNIDELVKKTLDNYIYDPKRLIIDAVSQNNETGSSTCVVVTLDKHKPLLYTANLGDSGYMLLRKSGLDLVQVFKSKEQTHSFNFPFQVGTGGDDPASADVNQHQVQDRDIVLLASDGLFDNLFNVKIIELIRPFVRDRDDILDPQIVAEVIAKEAERYSHNQNYTSPFCKSAREHFYDYRGGKPDDVTVLVAQIILGDQSDKGAKVEGTIIE